METTGLRYRRPVVRYPGGKARLLDWLVPIAESIPHTLYVETHGGAGNLLLAKRRVQGEIYNDIYDEIRNVFLVLRDKKMAKELYRLCKLTPFAYSEFQHCYESFEGLSPVERARRTIFRGFAAIGSNGISRSKTGFRGTKNNDTDVTAAKEWDSWPENIAFFTQRLQGVTIEGRDALKVIKTYDRESALFYVDPPYDRKTRDRKKLYKHEYTEQQQRELATLLHEVKGKVLVSGYDGPLYQELYGDWRVMKTKTTAQNGGIRIECLWLSPNIVGQQQELF